MNVAALLTGRGNNTMRDKNVRTVLGKPLLHYPAEAARKSRFVTSWYCSSDDEKILTAAEAEGYRRILRPAELALPTAQHVDCIVHGLREMEKAGTMPDVVVVLLANNVTVKTRWIDDCIQMMVDDPSLTSVVPVYQDNDHHPLRAKSLNAAGLLEMYEKGITGKVSTNRQDLPPCYFLAHNFWVLNVANVLSGAEGQPPWGFMGTRIRPYEIECSIDVHEPVDLIVAERWLREHTE